MVNFITCAYYINFVSTFPFHFIPMKACNSNFIWEVTGKLMQLSKPLSPRVIAYRDIGTVEDYG